MRRLTSLVVAFALVLTFAVPPKKAEAQFAVYDAINWIENALQVLQQVYEIYQRYQQLYNDYQRYATMVKNLEQFDELTFANLLGLTEAINEILQYGEALGHTLEDIDSQFAETFPGYESILNEEWLAIFEYRNRRALDTLHQSMNAIHLVSEEVVGAQDMLSRLAQDAEAADGNIEALTAANEFLHHQSGQLVTISQQLSVLANVQAVYWGYKVDQEAADRATASEWIENGAGEVPPYDGLTGVRGVPDDWPWPCFGCGRSLRRAGR